MNIELFEGQSCLVHVKLPEEWKVYGGTPKGEFRSERESADSVLVTVPAMEAEFTPLVPYELFARRTLDGKEWLVLSGQLHVRRRYSDAGGGISAIEYFVEPQLVEDGISSSPQIIIGIPGPQGPKGDKGDPGTGGMTSEERTTLAGAAQRDSANTFSAANTFTGSVDMSGASVTPPSGWNVGDLTPEAIQAVAPIAWSVGDSGASVAANGDGGIAIGKAARSVGNQGIAIGKNSYSHSRGVGIGNNAECANNSAIVIGAQARHGGVDGIAIGARANGGMPYSRHYAIAIGAGTKCSADNTIAFGAAFTETTDSGNVTHTCTTEGTGSITIGAGANTLNNGDTESSNSVTIGCKALNQGADSVVIGASSSTTQANATVLGARATVTGLDSVAIGNGAAAGSWRTTAVGKNSTASGVWSSAFGSYATATKQNATALGEGAHAKAQNATAVGYYAAAADVGVMAFRSEAMDGTYTQLYFSGANTPLANTYENGEAMMGYVVRDKSGNIMTDAEGNAMVGTQKLSVLFPNNRGENAFTPAMLSMDDGWTPKPMFHPSDLDLPTEEPSEPEEYTPLPVWPIVEPDDIMGDNGTLEQGGTENTSPETNS